MELSSVDACDTKVDSNTVFSNTVFAPSERLQLLLERPKQRLHMLFGELRQHPNSSNALGLLRARGKRSRRYRAAKELEKFATLHVPPQELS
jgi:hypothetical protein